MASLPGDNTEEPSDDAMTSAVPNNIRKVLEVWRTHKSDYIWLKGWCIDAVVSFFRREITNLVRESVTESELMVCALAMNAALMFADQAMECRLKEGSLNGSDRQRIRRRYEILLEVQCFTRLSQHMRRFSHQAFPVGRCYSYHSDFANGKLNAYAITTESNKVEIMTQMQQQVEDDPSVRATVEIIMRYLCASRDFSCADFLEVHSKRSNFKDPYDWVIDSFLLGACANLYEPHEDEILDLRPSASGPPQSSIKKVLKYLESHFS